MTQGTGVTVFITYRDERGEPLLEHDLLDEIHFPHLSFAEDVTEEMVLSQVAIQLLMSKEDYPQLNIDYLVVDSFPQNHSG